MFSSNACCFRKGQLKQLGREREKQKHFIQAKTLEKIRANQNENNNKKKLPENPTPYPFIYHFSRKRYPFRIPSISDERCPFHKPFLELCIPFECCKCTVFHIEINLKNSLYTDVVLFFFSFLPPCSGGQ